MTFICIRSCHFVLKPPTRPYPCHRLGSSGPPWTTARHAPGSVAASDMLGPVAAE